jgi:hypothetical protein
MRKHYGKANKGFAKAHYNRTKEKMERLLRKKRQARLEGGKPLTKAEAEWLKNILGF